MRGRIWMLGGAAAGVAVSLGRVPVLAGAARSLADTAQRLVADGSGRLITDAASSGAPQRVVLGAGALIGVLLPGLTSLLLIVAARGTLRVRAIAGLAIVALGALAYVYQPEGIATGELALALVVAGLAVGLTGPLVAAPLAGLAALIGAQFLPQLIEGRFSPASANVDMAHQALTGHPGTPAYLQVLLLVVAAVPFAYAGRLLIES